MAISCFPQFYCAHYKLDVPPWYMLIEVQTNSNWVFKQSLSFFLMIPRCYLIHTIGGKLSIIYQKNIYFCSSDGSLAVCIYGSNVRVSNSALQTESSDVVEHIIAQTHTIFSLIVFVRTHLISANYIETSNLYKLLVPFNQLRKKHAATKTACLTHVVGIRTYQSNSQTRRNFFRFPKLVYSER